ncbi:tRNA (guanine-N1)-methyltransferase [Ancylomarina salipaludis]|uniref:tRNA (Guanine-N1)-methyltransferase n=1 Tax=Ancylomarina salipaludis TaxID=2501299 RepID=A0A4Q1JLN0_9BACT|nr:tRNA (guanine-N1)-methyltransferase [Ancylomarina salipaludis]RXQ94492.1 tRNA (guanine-N1)-methyltransferase [Ancylomarina salipaludis]
MNTTKIFPTLILIFCLSFVVSAQTNDAEQTQAQQTENTQSVVKPRTYIKDAPIKEQFEFMMEKSSRWKSYKVIEIAWLQKFQSGFIDSLNAIRNDYLGAEKLIAERDKTIKSLELDLKEKKDALATIQNEKDSMSLLGIQMSKASYNLFIWSLVGGLLVLTGFFFLLFKRSNSVTKETHIRLEEVREEFDTHRKNALVREQKLARKLQDEINKNRNLGM